MTRAGIPRALARGSSRSPSDKKIPVHIRGGLSARGFCDSMCPRGFKPSGTSPQMWGILHRGHNRVSITAEGITQEQKSQTQTKFNKP